MKTFLEKNKKIILCFLVLASALSLINTISKGMVNSCDFQWQPAVLFWDGINHYQKFILNGKGDFLCQNGEYAHLLHVLYLPFTFFEWEKAKIIWLSINVIFVFLIPQMICKHLKLSKYKSILLLLIFITCYPSRMTLNYGQQSLFVMFFMLLPFIFINSKLSAFFSGFSSVKYSSGYVIFLNFIASKEYKNFFIAVTPYLIGWIIYFIFTNSNPLINFFEPIELSLKKGYVRDADIFSLINMYFLNSSGVILKFIFVIFIFLINYFILVQINKNNNPFYRASLILFCPLIFFPHSNYDYVLLFPLLCYSFLNNDYLINKINICFIIYFYYFNRIINHLINFDVLYQPLLLLFMTILLILNLHSYKYKSNLYFFNMKLI